jgi:hypothetical protein
MKYNLKEKAKEPKCCGKCEYFYLNKPATMQGKCMIFRKADIAAEMNADPCIHFRRA